MVAVLEKVKIDAIETMIGITKIYPNPFSNEMYIEFDIDFDQTISAEIYDILGNKVYSGNKTNYKIGKNSITIRANLRKGNYTLYLKGDTYSCSKKITRK